MVFLKQIRRLFFILLYAGGAYATVSAQIFTDNRRTFSYKDDSTVMPGDVHIHHILFEYSKCNFYHEFADTLNLLANYLIRNPNIQVTITLHSDTRGSIEANKKLTHCRAEYIADYLKGRGVPKTQYQSLAKGEEEP